MRRRSAPLGEGAKRVVARAAIEWFHKGPLKGWRAMTVNARAESVATAPAFRDAFARRRCLVPADGWVEFM